MKKFVLITMALFISAGTLFAQAPDGFRYQATLRDDQGEPLNNQTVSFQFTIREGGANGTTVYTETHDGLETDPFGMIELTVGTGTTSGNLSTIQWDNGPYYMDVRIDFDGGTDYQNMYLNQKLVSVPFALYAGNGITAQQDTLINTITQKANSSDVYTKSETYSKSEVYGKGTVDFKIDSLAANIPSTDDADADSTNELQKFRMSDDTLYIEKRTGDKYSFVELDYGSLATTFQKATLDASYDSLRLFPNPDGYKAAFLGRFNQSAEVATNAADIATNTSDISTNASDISTNAGNISTNATNISGNATDISANTSNISTNTSAIATINSDIADDADSIGTNFTNIATNTSNIATNTADIATNASDITALEAKQENDSTVLASRIYNVSVTAVNNRDSLTVHRTDINENYDLIDSVNTLRIADSTFLYDEMSFRTLSDVTYNVDDVSTWDNDFVFGSPSLDYGTQGNRFLFDKSLGAFRAGSCQNTEWNTANLGTSSAAFGNRTTASGVSSFAIGLQTTASGNYAFAGGQSSTATDGWSFSYGYMNNATGQATAALGYGTRAKAYAMTAVGIYNNVYDGQTNFYDAADPIFVVGNGINSGSRSDALVIYKDGDATLNGNLTFGATKSFTMANGAGASKLMISDGSGNASWGPVLIFSRTGNIVSNGSYGGTISTDDFVFGDNGLDFNTENNRIIFDKSTGAFRAGGTNGTEWNTVSRGNYSFAAGYNTQAFGTYSVSMGGFNSVAGDSAVSLGAGNDVSGVGAVGIGVYNNVSSDYGQALGTGLLTDAYGQVVVGMFNEDPAGSLTPDAYVNTDPIFTVGAGTSDGSRGDAFVVYKDSTVEMTGGVYHNVTNTGGAYTVKVTDYIVICNAAGAVTLPDPTTCAGRMIITKNTTGGAITVDDAGAANFYPDGGASVASYSLPANESQQWVSDGTNWIGF